MASYDYADPSEVVAGSPVTYNDPGSYGTPGAYSPGATNWLDLLKTGIGHYASYQTALLNRPVTQNAQYTNATQPAPAVSQRNAQLVRWALIGGAVFMGALALSKFKAA